MRKISFVGFGLMVAGSLMAQPGGGSPALQRASLLDVEGKYPEARELFLEEIDTAANPRATNAQRGMAISYAFEGNCAKTFAKRRAWVSKRAN